MLTLYLRDQNNKLYYVTEGSSAQLNKLCKRIDKKGGQYWISKSPYLHGQSLNIGNESDQKQPVIIRIENMPDFYEYNKPILIWLNGDYCACTGHGSGDLNALIEQTREITLNELNALNGQLYGYNLKDFMLLAGVD